MENKRKTLVGSLALFWLAFVCWLACARLVAGCFFFWMMRNDDDRSMCASLSLSLSHSPAHSHFPVCHFPLHTLFQPFNTGIRPARQQSTHTSHAISTEFYFPRMHTLGTQHTHLHSLALWPILSVFLYFYFRLPLVSNEYSSFYSFLLNRMMPNVAHRQIV